MGVKKPWSYFLEKFKTNHGDKYDYSLVEGNPGSHGKIIVICPIHGKFEQIVQNHYNGKGCSICSFTKANQEKRNTLEEFLSQCVETHGNKYDYSKVEYTLSSQKVCIICPNHGEFYQQAQSHINGRNCPECAIQQTRKK